MSDDECGTCQCRWCGGEYDNSAIQDVVEMYNAALARAERAERERDEARFLCRTLVQGYPPIPGAPTVADLPWEEGDE